MPSFIIEYINSNYNLAQMNHQIKGNIVTSYTADMSKYTTVSENLKINEIYQSIPEQLGKENKKFVYSTIKEGARSDHYKSSISWLIDSHLVLKSNLLKLPSFPLRAYKENTFFKLYINDTGLSCRLVNIKSRHYYG